MCAAPNGGTWKVSDLLTRPHRFFGGPSLIDPMLHPNDEYNLPKTPQTEAVVERQAYKDASTRAQLASGYDANRRRIIAGVATSALGVPGAASTTRGVVAVGGG